MQVLILDIVYVVVENAGQMWSTDKRLVLGNEYPMLQYSFSLCLLQN